MNKKTIIALACLVVALLLVVGIWVLAGGNKLAGSNKLAGGNKKEDSGATVGTDPQGSTIVGCSFTVVVVHADGTEKTFQYTSDKEFLSQCLYEDGLVVADEANPGMFHTVDGEKADWNRDHSYWLLCEGDIMLNTGIETTPIKEGAVYKLIYSHG